MFSAIGVWAMATGPLQLSDPTASDRLWLAPVWPILLTLGGVLAAMFARRMTNMRLRAWAASLLVLACVGRAAAMSLALIDATAHSWQSAVGGFSVWSFLGWLLYVTWRVRVPRPVDHGDGRDG